jgi:hypothetical protein
MDLDQAEAASQIAARCDPEVVDYVVTFDVFVLIVAAIEALQEQVDEIVATASGSPVDAREREGLSDHRRDDGRQRTASAA